jgi:hypothetical protein
MTVLGAATSRRLAPPDDGTIDVVVGVGYAPPPDRPGSACHRPQTHTRLPIYFLNQDRPAATYQRSPHLSLRRPAQAETRRAQLPTSACAPGVPGRRLQPPLGPFLRAELAKSADIESRAVACLNLGGGLRGRLFLGHSTGRAFPTARSFAARRHRHPWQIIMSCGKRYPRWFDRPGRLNGSAARIWPAPLIIRFLILVGQHRTKLPTARCRKLASCTIAEPAAGTLKAKYAKAQQRRASGGALRHRNFNSGPGTTFPLDIEPKPTAVDLSNVAPVRPCRRLCQAGLTRPSQTWPAPRCAERGVPAGIEPGAGVSSRPLTLAPRGPAYRPPEAGPLPPRLHLCRFDSSIRVCPKETSLQGGSQIHLTAQKRLVIWKPTY